MFNQRLRYCYSGSYCYSRSLLLANIAYGQHWKHCYSGEYCYNGDCCSGALLFFTLVILWIPWWYLFNICSGLSADTGFCCSTIYRIHSDMCTVHQCACCYTSVWYQHRSIVCFLLMYNNIITLNIPWQLMPLIFTAKNIINARFFWHFMFLITSLHMCITSVEFKLKLYLFIGKQLFSVTWNNCNLWIFNLLYLITKVLKLKQIISRFREKLARKTTLTRLINFSL